MSELTMSDYNRMKKHPKLKSAIIEYETSVTGVSQSYNEFVNRVIEEIDLAIKHLESGRSYFNELPEDGLTKFLCSLLQQKSLSASHGEYAGGATDLRITHGSHEWLGEAKWWNADINPIEGMRQLTTRYSTGVGGGDSGGVLLYNKTSNAANKVVRLRELFRTMTEEFKDIPKLLGYAGFQREFKWSNARHLS